MKIKVFSCEADGNYKQSSTLKGRLYADGYKTGKSKWKPKVECHTCNSQNCAICTCKGINCGCVNCVGCYSYTPPPIKDDESENNNSNSGESEG